MAEDWGWGKDSPLQMGTGEPPSARLSLGTEGPDFVSALRAPPVDALGSLWVSLLGLVHCTVSTCTETVPTTHAE